MEPAATTQNDQHQEVSISLPPPEQSRDQPGNRVVRRAERQGVWEGATEGRGGGVAAPSEPKKTKQKKKKKYKTTKKKQSLAVHLPRFFPSGQGGDGKKTDFRGGALGGGGGNQGGGGGGGGKKKKGVPAAELRTGGG